MSAPTFFGELMRFWDVAIMAWADTLREVDADPSGQMTRPPFVEGPPLPGYPQVQPLPVADTSSVGGQTYTCADCDRRVRAILGVEINHLPKCPRSP